MTAHRYWRLFIADNFEPSGANRYYTSLTELEMFTTVGGSNVCTGGTAIASSDYTGDGWSMNNAFDVAKNVDIGWAANNVAPPAWIGYDFGAGNEKDVVQYSFTVRSSAGSMTQSPRIFTLQYSDDGIEWFSSDGTVIKSTLWNANESLTRTTSMHFSATKRFTPVVRQFDSSTASIYAAQNCFKGDSDISGTIRVDGDEIENAVVHLKDAATGLHLRSTLTNVLGDYEFKNLRRDKLYDVVAEDPLKEWEKVVSSRRTPLFEFKMRPKMHDGAHVYIPYMMGIHHPSFSNVKSLLQGAGADGSTTITDDTGRSWTQVGNLQVDDSLGVNLLLSDGANDRASTPYEYADFNWWTSDFTIEAWVQASSWTNWGSTTSSALVGNYAYDGGTNYWSFGPLTNGKLGFYYYNGSSVPNSFGTIPTGEIVHIAMTYSGGNIYLGINGEVSQPIAVSGTPQSSNAYPLGIGQHNGSHCPGYFAIRISREALYKHAYEVPELNVPSS